jgi:hypothetical protein
MTGKDAMWMREVRKRTDSGHQSSLISTAFDLPHTQLAGRMFSRWCQENFFNYIMQHFDIELTWLKQYNNLAHSRDGVTERHMETGVCDVFIRFQHIY